MVSDQSCNSRHFSWLAKSCFPNPQDSTISSAVAVPPTNKSLFQPHRTSASSATTTLSALPDDLLLDCLSRVPSSSIPSISFVCRHWSRLILSPAFFDLRRFHGQLHHTIFALAATDSGLFAASFRLHHDEFWKVALFRANDDVSLGNFQGLLSHARLSAIGPRIYIIGRSSMVRYDTWNGMVTARSAMTFSRKKFANAVVSGRIYVAGGCPTTTAVEEYNPETNTWRIITHAPRRRYGCIGASVDGVFYVIGGLKIGETRNDNSRNAAGTEAHVYASSMDLYDVESNSWLRSKVLPGGGCVVAACSAMGFIYVLASHAVELSFWKFDARRKNTSSSGTELSFGEWSRIKSPPLPAQVRLDSTVRFTCVGVEDKVALIQISGCIDDLLRRSGRTVRGLREGLVLVYDCVAGEWRRGVDLPEVNRRAACVSVES